MKWVESFSTQARICEREGLQFVIPKSFTNRDAVVVCVQMKTYCHSQACYHDRVPNHKEVEPETQEESALQQPGLSMFGLR